MKKILLLALLVSSSIEAQDRFGSLQGQIVDAATLQPLAGANIVVVEKPALGSSTDSSGYFVVNHLDVGEYSVKVSLLGYKSAVLTNVVVSTGRSTKVKIRLNEEAVQVGAVEVKADYFSAEGMIGPVSTVGLSGAEVWRSPGADQDMQRIMQNLPGVASSTDENNELIVRGGSPDENLTVMDHIEIPSTNHYPNQMNSGGPINMVNVDLIEDIRFSTGGFPANYGDKLSSVMDISMREGDKDRTVAGNAAFNFAGIGSVLEGGFADGKGTWVFSARQSLLEFINQIVGISSIGLTAIPKYYDLQGKGTYELSPTQKLTVNGIFGNDKIFIDGIPDQTNTQKRNVVDSSNVENVDDRSQQFAVGATLRTLYGAEGYSLLSVYMIGNRYDVNVSDDFTFRQYDANGKVVRYQTLLSQPTYVNNSIEQMLGTKYDFLYRLTPYNELSLGAIGLTTQKFQDNVYFNSDTLRYDLNHDGIWDTTTTYQNGRISKQIGFGEQFKLGGYVSDKISFSERLTGTAGLRYDYFTYSKKGNWSPRINFSYELAPPSTKLNFAYGEYYQTLALPTYGDNSGGDKNRYLDNSHARHFIAGIEQLWGEGLKATLEAYYKSYDHLPVGEQFIMSADQTFRSDSLVSVGKRTSKGIEFFLQQKQVEDYYGTISVSYTGTRTIDPRVNIPGQPAINVGSYPFDYDFPLLITLVAGKVVKNVRTSLDDMPFYLKYPAKILPLSDDMEISFRFRYSSGQPYTPEVYTPYIQAREAGVAWTKGYWSTGSEVNSVRLPAYHRLDIQWLSRWHLSGYNIVAYIAVQNVYNRQNVAGYQYVSDGTINTIYQFSLLPIGGMTIEF